MQRRQILQTGTAAAALLAAPRLARAETGFTRFSVWRKGDDIGSHTLRKTKTGDDIVVDIDIELTVKLAFIPLYAYVHKNQERWRGKDLLGFQSDTDDNGDEFRVDAKKDGDQIIANSNIGSFEHPAARRATTYWHKSFLADTNWINSQNGEPVLCEIVDQGSKSLEIPGRTVETDFFSLKGDLNLDLWYLGNEWVKLVFTGEDGSVIEYRLEELEPLEIDLA